ncbi:alpha/beta fold hydrolase [Pantoea agglomerans]|uniref:alpha/beta fold hydrolase n=1 Tax=Enterobacter agglomerans TaxID=549 RepID=UPI00077A7932
MISNQDKTVIDLEFNNPENHYMVRVNNIRTHYVSAGTGPVVVLVAGFPQSCYAWRKVFPVLAKKFRVIAIDLPGQGDSEKVTDGYDTSSAASHINQLLNELGVTRCLYVGHDIGAWIGFAYSHLYSSSLRGVVLIDGNIPGVTLQTTIKLGPDNWRNWHFLFNPIADLPEALFLNNERTLIEWFFNNKSLNFSSTFSTSDIDEYERVYATLGGMRGMLGYYRAVLEDIEQNQRLMKNKIAVPLLALGGDQGSAPDLYEKMKDLGVNVSGGVIRNSGHYIPEEQPEALCDEILGFESSLLND